MVSMMQFLFGQGEQNGSLIDRIKQLDRSNLQAYAEPLMTGFGIALGTGIFYSASSHDVLEFDVGFRYMQVGIPSSARYFTATAVACSLADGELDCYDVVVEEASTIFGPGEATWVPTSGNAVAVPPVFPGGLNVTSVPFVMPQINVGFPFGLELSFGYLPLALTFPLDLEKSIYFLRVGGKLSINEFFLLRGVSFPCALALGGFYQKGRIKDERETGSVSIALWNFQIMASRRYSTRLPFDVEPFLAGGIEGTRYNFRYDFQKVIPDTIGGVPTDSILVIEPVDVEFHQQNRLRAIAGLTFYIGPIYLHYDYNIVTYNTHNMMFGIKIR